MSHPVEAFVNRLSTVFGEPKSKDFAAYIEEISRHMSKYAADELQEAATKLMQTAKFRTWPLPAEMLEAAEAARNDLLNKARQNNPKAQHENFDPFSAQSKAAAYRLIKSDMGRDAANHGWIGQLFSFCCKHRRLPTNREKFDLIEKARLFDELYAKTCRDLETAADSPADKRKPLGHWQPIGGSTIQLLATGKKALEGFLDERNRLSEIAHGSAAE